MHFNESIEKEKYQAFCKEKNSDFMQTYEWGQFQIKGRGQIPHYVGMEDENGNLLCASLLLERKGPFGYCYFYSPRGYIIDFSDKHLLTEFTEELKKFLKRKKGIYLKVDPDIVYQKIDENGKAIDGENRKDFYDTMIELGYHHTGFNLYFDHNQPRYTFRIDYQKPFSEIEKKIHKSILKKIRKTNQYHMTFRESNDIQTFYHLIQDVSERDDFSAYSLDYYQNFYDMMSKSGYAKVFELVMNPKLLVKERMEELEKLSLSLQNQEVKENDVINVQNSCERLKKEIHLLEPYQEKEEVVVCSQVCACNQTRLWTLYIGNNDLGREFYAVNRMYYEVIKYGKEHGYQDLDLFGTVGDPNTTLHNYAGLHNFKKNFGGEYTELIGEFDLIQHRVLYRVLPIILKVYRKFKKKR